MRFSMSGIDVTWPPTTIVDRGECRRMSRHISATLPTFTTMDEIPTTSYCADSSSRMKRSRVGKSRTVHGAEMFSRRNIRLHVRWNIRSEKGPCSRVTWLWYSSAGLMVRDPNSSSIANGLNTDVSSTLMPTIVRPDPRAVTARQNCYNLPDFRRRHAPHDGRHRHGS